jgi:aminopeptidase N
MRDNLWNEAVYHRGACFYRAVAGRVGVEALGAVLARFYQQHVGRAARMTDMLDLIRTETGYDPTVCVDLWLRSPALPRPGPCP